MVAGILEYAAHAIAYSVLAAVVVELLLAVWRIKDPPLGIAFRMLVLAAPPVAPLLFGLPELGWGPQEPRAHLALLHLENWLGPLPSPTHPMWAALVLAMLATAGLEGVAFLRWLQAGRAGEPRRPSEASHRLRSAAKSLAGKGLCLPSVRVVPQSCPVACTVGLFRQSILVSPALIDMLDDEELEGVLAHEWAHAARLDNWLGWLMFSLRVFSFYNPVVQFTFHRIGHDIEKVCDAEAGGATGKPLALASALIKVYLRTRTAARRTGARRRQVSTQAIALENRARRTLVEDRVERLVHPEAVMPTTFPQVRLALAAATVIGLSYFVV